MSSRSSKKIYEAEKLNQDYQSYFGGKYSAARNGGISGIKDIWKIAVLSKCRLFILFCICVIISMYILYNSKPRWIIQRRKSYDEPDKVSVYYLLMYSLIIGLFITIGLSIISYRFPKIKSFIFKTDECDLCQE